MRTNSVLLITSLYLGVTFPYASAEAPNGMIWIPGGHFMMGTDEVESYPAERPARGVRMEGFWMDETEVTNEQFFRFVEATGHVTVAEGTPDWEQLKSQLPPGSPKPPPEMLGPGSLVFVSPATPISNNDIGLWWRWTPGANWRHPEGKESHLDGRWDHPVVHVAWDDAAAYARWAGKRLPTEAEWEFAARGGLVQKRYAWGDELRPDGRHMANIWQGRFPDLNRQEDGYAGTAPVKSFPPNGYGLYDMIGNVWEWCSDRFEVLGSGTATPSDVLENPSGPERSPDLTLIDAAQRVTKGGSFLCSENYCLNYRPSARRGTAWDSGMSHLGFRCAVSATEEHR